MSKNKKLAVIDGETLMDMRIKPIIFYIDSLLPQGVSMLCGAPKIGKSWLVIIDMMQEIEKFSSSNAEFVDEYNSRTGMNLTARLLKRMMNKWRYELEESGVYFESFRDKNVRGLKIRYEPFGDDGDVKYDESTAL